MSLSTCSAVASASCLLALYFWPEISQTSRRPSAVSTSQDKRQVLGDSAAESRQDIVAEDLRESPLDPNELLSGGCSTRRKVVKFELHRNVWVSPERFHDDEGAADAHPQQQR